MQRGKLSFSRDIGFYELTEQDGMDLQRISGLLTEAQPTARKGHSLVLWAGLPAVPFGSGSGP
jgi:hypothetical protein